VSCNFRLLPRRRVAAALATAGKLALGSIFFNAIAKGGRADVIASASDPRIPGVYRVTQAF
jgi:hypothetical protein